MNYPKITYQEALRAYGPEIKNPGSVWYDQKGQVWTLNKTGRGGNYYNDNNGAIVFVKTEQHVDTYGLFPQAPIVAKLTKSMATYGVDVSILSRLPIEYDLALSGLTFFPGGSYRWLYSWEKVSSIAQASGVDPSAFLGIEVWTDATTSPAFSFS